MRLLPLLGFLVLLTSPAFGQSTLLQGGPVTAGHAPMYTKSGSGQQPVVVDSGPAGGGANSVGLSELGVTARGTGTPPYAQQGTGPGGTNICDYDAPITNATGYHFLCFSANAQGGGLIDYGKGGTATALPLHVIVNGVTIPISAGSGTVQQVNTGSGLTGGPITTTGTISLANAIGTTGATIPLNNTPNVFSSTTTIPFSFFGTLDGQTSFLGRYANAGSHVNQQVAGWAIESTPAGSGTNGPQSDDVGLAVAMKKSGYPTSAVYGEFDGIYLDMRQTGPVSDGGAGHGSDSCALCVALQIQNGAGFSVLSEAVNIELNRADQTVLRQIDTQINSINSVPGGNASAYFAEVQTGSINTGLEIAVNNGAGASIGHFLAFENISGGAVFSVAGDGRIDVGSYAATPISAAYGGNSGVWVGWTPSYTTSATQGSFAAVTDSAFHQASGNLDCFVLQFHVTNISGATGTVQFSIPSSAVGTFVFSGRDATTGSMVNGLVVSPTVVKINKYDNSDILATDIFFINGCYQK